MTKKGVLHRDSCFNLWHTKRDIEAERKKTDAAKRKRSAVTTVLTEVFFYRS
jgi:hypothetical protein